MEKGKFRVYISAGILWLILCCCMILPFTGSAQVLITGTVRDNVSQIPLYRATVFDKSTGDVVATDSSGFYSIHAGGGDTISYSFVGFYTKDYVVPLQLTRIIHDVDLATQKHQLTEVEIKALTPYQRDSLDRIETFGHYLDQPKTHFVGLNTHSPYDIPNPNYNDAFGISLNPFTFFSKKNSERRHFDKMYPKFEKQAFINSRYTPDLVNKLTGMTGDSLSLFLYKFRPSYELVRTAPDLVFWSWIKIQYKSWIKLK
ncbi:MAG: carboxypeptidase-like regulatory domain-containing protein [Chitinophagaceae bacterium]